MKKCYFMVKTPIFLGNGMWVNEQKVKAIHDLSTPKSVTNIRSFHGLTILYRRFIRNFSPIVVTLIDSLKRGKFQWRLKQEKSFNLIKEKLSTAPVLVLPIFDKLFVIKCDASSLEPGAALSQEEMPIAFLARNSVGHNINGLLMTKNFMQQSEL